MGTRGGRRSTSYTPTWRHGRTRTIRVPISLSQQLLEAARQLDQELSVEDAAKFLHNTDRVCQIAAENFGNEYPFGVTQANPKIILDALDRFTESQQHIAKGNQHKRKGEIVDINTSRDWTKLMEFRKCVEIEYRFCKY